MCEFEVMSVNVVKYLAFGSIARVDKFMWWLFIFDYVMMLEGIVEDVVVLNIFVCVFEVLDGCW